MASPTGTVPTTATLTTTSITPILYTLSKSVAAPDNETATGPNYPRTWSINSAIAPGQTLTNFFITDALPNNIVIVPGSIVLTPLTGTIVIAPTTGVPANGNQIVAQWPSAPRGEPTANLIPVLCVQRRRERQSGAATHNRRVRSSSNSASSTAGWTANGGALPARPRRRVRINDRSLAVQKSVAASNPILSSGTLLTYSLNFQISDYFSMNNIVITDTLDNAQDWTPGSFSMSFW
jgi:hypothetical protein